MAKRELSSTLKNLKFMQRATQKDEKAKKEEELIPSRGFPSCSSVKRCVVIVEGDPCPGATRGRLSFLSFNPTLDKLNGEACVLSENGSTATRSGSQNEAISSRLDNNLELDASSNASNGDLKRKKTEVPEARCPNKSLKNFQGNLVDSSPTSSHHSQKQHKHEKLDWSVLRHPKPQSKKR